MRHCGARASRGGHVRFPRPLQCIRIELECVCDRCETGLRITACNVNLTSNRSNHRVMNRDRNRWTRPPLVCGRVVNLHHTRAATIRVDTADHQYPAFNGSDTHLLARRRKRWDRRPRSGLKQQKSTPKDHVPVPALISRNLSANPSTPLAQLRDSSFFPQPASQFSGFI